MPINCAVCRKQNNERKFLLPNPKRVDLFDLFDKWIDFIDNPTYKNKSRKRLYETLRVCALHFKDADFTGLNNSLSYFACPSIPPKENTYGVKEERENNVYVGDRVLVTETTCNMSLAELQDYVETDEIRQGELSYGKLTDSGLSSSEARSNGGNENVKIEEVEAADIHDIKIEYDNGLLQTAYSVKEDSENNVYVDTEVFLNESHTELKYYVKSDEIRQSEPTSGKLMETGLSTSEAHGNRSNEDVKIEEEVGIIRDVKIECDSRLLLCVHCQTYYEDYCITCGMLVHVLNETFPSNTDNRTRELPKDILEIVDLFDHFEIFASKIIPQGVKFGPFTGLGTSGCTWKLKGGKFVASEDTLKLLNWMQHVNSARNIDEQNLLPFQCQNNLYYRTTRQIQNGEELLVYFGREYEDNVNNDVEMDFTPPTEDGTEDVFACTFCCLGFSSREYLVKHKSICAKETNANFSIEELTRCPLCKIYLGKMEYSKCHMTYCHDRNARNCTPLVFENEMIETNKKRKTRRRQTYRCAQSKYRTMYKEDHKSHTSKHYEVKMPKCGICCQRFKTKGSLKAHVEKKHVLVGERKARKQLKSDPRKANTNVKLSKVRLKPHDYAKQFKCEMCDFRTKTKHYMKAHVKAMHLKEFSHECEMCDHKTNWKSNLEIHIKTKHLKEFSHECELCYFKTNVKSHLNRHVKAKHLKEFSHQCEICGYKTNENSNLEIHINRKHFKEFKHECEICDYKTNVQSRLETHINNKHLKKFNHVCATCDFKTSLKSDLETHMKTTHPKEFSYECEICDYKTNLKSILEIHTKTKHLKVFSHECEICDFKAHVKSHLEIHIKTEHLKEFSHVCEKCDFKTNVESLLKVHIKTKHQTEFSYECEMCNFKTNVKPHLKRHINTKHLKKFSHECEICDYKTNVKSYLKIHVKTKHLKEFSHECKICDYKTNVKTHLEVHINTRHLKKFNQVCEICDFKTNLKANLEIHIKTKHLKEFSHECAMCDFKTNVKSQFEIHIKTKHLKEYRHECESCDFKTNVKQHIEIHIKTKHLKEFSHECEMCDYKTNVKSHLNIHVKTKHLKEFSHECEICDFKTNKNSHLKRHMDAKHLKEFNHQCEMCDYKTNLKSYLKAHIRTKHLKVFSQVCKICDYKTNEKSNLKKHIKAKHQQDERV